MTTTTSRVPAVIDYLVTTFTNDVTLGANPTNPVTIMDGPQIQQTPDMLRLWVGMDDPDSNSNPISAESEREWAALGRQAQNEHITIHLVAEATSGGTDVRAARVAAYSIVAAVETLLRQDNLLGGSIATGWSLVGNGQQLNQLNVSQGASARVSFHIECTARV